MFERHYRELLDFLARRLPDRETAADLTQESFARVYAAQRAGTTIRDPRALLYRVARNLLTDDYRRNGARQAAGAEADASHRPAPDGADLAAVEPDQHAGPAALEPEQALNARQRLEALANIIDQLPPRCRQAFVLVKFEHLSHAEAAQRMGIAIKTVEMQVRIALVACRQGLADFENDRPTPTVRPKPGRPRKTAGPPPTPDH